MRVNSTTRGPTPEAQSIGSSMSYGITAPGFNKDYDIYRGNLVAFNNMILFSNSNSHSVKISSRAA